MTYKTKFAPGEKVFTPLSYQDGNARFDKVEIVAIKIDKSGISYKICPNYLRRIDEPPIYNYVKEEELLALDELKQYTISKIEQEINNLQKRLKEVRDGE